VTPSVQLDVESLRTLLAVLDHGGMTSAARHLHASQSAVSWKVKRLEERVGRPLLIREGHTIRPTRDGRAWIDDARRLVDIHDRAVARLQSSELTGTVKVGSNEEVDAEHIASLLGRFTRAHPLASIEFVIDNTEHLARQLDAGEIDVAVIQVADRDLRTDDVVLWTDVLCWVTSCEAPFDDGVVPLVTFGEHCFYRSFSEPLLTASGIHYTIAFSGHWTGGVRAAVEAGLGVGVLPSRHLGGDLVEWRRGRDGPPLPRIHQVARTVPGERPAVAAALIDAIADQLREPSASVIQPSAPVSLSRVAM
jgi:DNA-binding transcriptional LysR family regulator